MTTPGEMQPGVRPVDGEPLVYLVKSESRKGLRHRVDMTYWSGFGVCTCESFQMRILPLLQAGVKMVETLECPHIKKARRYMALEFIQSVIELRQKKAEENQIKNGHKPTPYNNEESPY